MEQNQNPVQPVTPNTPPQPLVQQPPVYEQPAAPQVQPINTQQQPVPVPITQQVPQPTPQPVTTMSSEDLAFQTLMPTKNKYSLISYYMGFLGLLPFVGFPFAIAAIIFANKALKLYKTNPTPGAKGHAIVGMVLGIFSVVCMSLFVLFFLLAFLTQDQ